MDEKTTTIAMMYDFDKTLTTKDQQEFTFIPDIEMEAAEFWKNSETMATDKKMDRVLAYMHCMLKEARHKDKEISKGAFIGHGKNLEYYPGVESWFRRINAYCTAMGIVVEHYVISSGLREIIKGSSIYNNFKEVFACEFLYDVHGVAIWPKNVVNYTTKTQFVFRINKGVLDLSDDKSLNGYTSDENRPIPFRNMIYIGDGLTDVPCMRLVKSNGGYSIAVYTDKSKVKELITHGRVDFIASADYTEDGELDIIIKNILLKMSTQDKLSALSKRQHDEMQD